MMVSMEPATVYRGATRRYLSRRAAERSFAKAAFMKLCECEPPIHADRYPGATCWYHSLPTVAAERAIDIYTERFVKAGREPSGEDVEALIDEISDSEAPKGDG